MESGTSFSGCCIVAAQTGWRASMRRSICLLLGISLVAVASSASAAPAFIGKWRAHAMTVKEKTQKVPKGVSITIEFLKGGKFVGTMEAKRPDGKAQKKVENGTWKVKGKTLITTGRKKTETMTFKVRGNTLTLTKAKRGETLTLKRVK